MSCWLIAVHHYLYLFHCIWLVVGLAIFWMHKLATNGLPPPSASPWPPTVCRGFAFQRWIPLFRTFFYIGASNCYSVFTTGPFDILLISNLPIFAKGNLFYKKSKLIFLFHWPSLQSFLRWHLNLIKIQTLIRVLVVYPSLCLFQEVTQTFPIEVTTVRITNQQSLQTSEKGWIFAFFSLEKILLCQPYGHGLFTNWHARFENLTLALGNTWFQHFY